MNQYKLHNIGVHEDSVLRSKKQQVLWLTEENQVSVV